MPIDLQRIANSPAAISLAVTLGRVLPRPWGYAIADGIAGKLAEQRQSGLARAVRANQWVVLGEPTDGEALDRAVYETLRNSARATFDLYHTIQSPKAAARLIVLDAATEQLSKRPEFGDRGLVVVGLHLSGFDLVLQWIGKQGMRPLTLTIPDPQGGRRLEYEMRSRTGLTLLPASAGALRQAIRHLQHGGVVLTGIDRPIPQPQMRPRFFGRPAALPMHHIFLAAKANVPVLPIASFLGPDGRYHVQMSTPIEMEAFQDREMERLWNAEKVLSVAERLIGHAPHQWSVSLPVWPEAVELAPR